MLYKLDHMYSVLQLVDELSIMTNFSIEHILNDLKYKMSLQIIST